MVAGTRVEDAGGGVIQDRAGRGLRGAARGGQRQVQVVLVDVDRVPAECLQDVAAELVQPPPVGPLAAPVDRVADVLRPVPEGVEDRVGHREPARAVDLGEVGYSGLRAAVHPRPIAEPVQRVRPGGQELKRRAGLARRVGLHVVVERCLRPEAQALRIGHRVGGGSRGLARRVRQLGERGLRPHVHRNEPPARGRLRADPGRGQVLLVARAVRAADVDADGAVGRVEPPGPHVGGARGRARVEAEAHVVGDNGRKFRGGVPEHDARTRLLVPRRHGLACAGPGPQTRRDCRGRCLDLRRGQASARQNRADKPGAGVERRGHADAGRGGDDLARDGILDRASLRRRRAGLDQQGLGRADQPARAVLIGAGRPEVDRVQIEPHAGVRSPGQPDDRPRPGNRKAVSVVADELHRRLGSRRVRPRPGGAGREGRARRGRAEREPRG